MVEDYLAEGNPVGRIIGRFKDVNIPSVDLDTDWTALGGPLVHNVIPFLAKSWGGGESPTINDFLVGLTTSGRLSEQFPIWDRAQDFQRNNPVLSFISDALAVVIPAGASAFGVTQVGVPLLVAASTNPVIKFVGQSLLAGWVGSRLVTKAIKEDLPSTIVVTPGGTTVAPPSPTPVEVVSTPPTVPQPAEPLPPPSPVQPTPLPPQLNMETLITALLAGLAGGAGRGLAQDFVSSDKPPVLHGGGGAPFFRTNDKARKRKKKKNSKATRMERAKLTSVAGSPTQNAADSLSRRRS
jgi:hypothetical protein